MIVNTTTIHQHHHHHHQQQQRHSNRPYQSIVITNEDDRGHKAVKRWSGWALVVHVARGVTIGGASDRARTRQRERDLVVAVGHDVAGAVHKLHLTTTIHTNRKTLIPVPLSISRGAPARAPTARMRASRDRHVGVTVVVLLPARGRCPGSPRRGCCRRRP